MLRDRLIDRIDDSCSIRRIGALPIARRLDEFPELERKAPRVVVYTGTSNLETRLDHALLALLGLRFYLRGTTKLP